MEEATTITQKKSADRSSRARHLIQLFIFLSLTIAVIHFFRIEYLGSFDSYFPIVAGVVLLHNLVSYRFRNYLFSFWTLLLLSLTAGPVLAAGTLAIILLAASISFIPQKILRNISAVFFFAVLIAGRLLFHNHGKIAAMIALAGIFIMLRFIFLLYEISHIKEKPSFLLRVNYLFMLPNIFFPLFPVVDPLVFFKHKEDDSLLAFEQGKTWLTRGILHLLLYRFIYLYVSPSVYELHSWFDLLLFILSGYSLILRLSGIFYLSGGILGLMGYKLPPVFENYFLVRNFRDLWRRINLYWRHFMWRVFYYPLLFKLKKWPAKTAVLVTVLVMFIVTWLLHGWQWYWVKGFFPLVNNDILYWSIFGIILAFVSLRAFSKSKRKEVSPFINGVGIVSMFFAMSLLWSLWTASSLQEWMYIMSKFGKLKMVELIYFSGAVAGIFLLGGIVGIIQKKTNLFLIFVNESKKEFRFVILILLGAAGIFYHFSKNKMNLPLAKMADPQLNMTDRAIAERGYYEQLLTTPKMARDMQPLFKKTEVNDFQNDAYESADSLFPRRLKANYQTTFKGKKFTTNKFGMRDKEYSLEKNSGIYRICLLGGSYEMGSGVADGEAYEQLIEDSLNKNGVACEILNMSVGGYHAIQMLKVAKTQCLHYHPDAIVYVCHSSEKQRMVNNILSLVSAKRELEFHFLKNIVKKSGIDPDKMCQVEMYDRLYPFGDTLLKCIYSEFAATCNENNIQPIWIYLPAIGDLHSENNEGGDMENLAYEAHLTVINVEHIFDQYETHKITVSDEDTHPNALGHRIIFEAIYRGIKETIERKIHAGQIVPKS